MVYAVIAAVLAIGSIVWLGSTLMAAGSAARMRSALRRAVPVVFLLSSGALLPFGRRWVLRYDQSLNPDEAEFAAAAMLTHRGWLNWNIADTTSSGPLNAAILAWPYLFGGDVTFFSTRLAGIVCIFGSLAFIYLALRRLSDDCIAIIATAPAFIFFSATTSSEFIHYSSEQLPIFLLSLAFYLFVRSLKDERLRYPIGAGMVLGLVPFAKLQAAPIAAVIGGFVVARVLVEAWKSSRLSAVLRAAAVCAAALLPALILLVPLVVSGEFDAFLNGYLLERWLIVVAKPWINMLPIFIEYSPFFAAVTAAGAAMFAVAAVRLVMFVRRRDLLSTLAPSIVWTSALAVTLTPVVLTCITASREPFFHYLLLAVPALLIAVGVAFAAVAVLVQPRAARHVALIEGVAFGIMLAIVLPAAHREQAGALERTASDGFLHGRLFAAAHNLDWLLPREKDRLVCWAWASQCYVDAAILPATRDVTNEYQIYETALRPYFRSRFLQDFARSRPDFIMDFSAPGNFAYGMWWFDQDIAKFPEFAGIIQTNFDLVSRVEPADRCPRLYVRKARLAELNRSLINFASLGASASMPGHSVSALDDGSIFETCDDNWLLPAGALGAAMIRFDRAEPLRSVAMLSTRDGADRVRLSIHLMGATVAANDLTLARFPRWTWYRLDQPITADGFTIEILSSRGAHAGLNEVKAYRD